MWHKKEFLTFVSLVIVGLITIGGIPLNVRESSAQGGDTKPLGGARMDQYCTSHGYVGVEVDGSQNNVFGLGCKDSSGVRHGIDMFDVCRFFWGNEYANPQYSDFNNSDSWYCARANTPAPTAIPQSTPVPPQPTAVPPQPPVVQPDQPQQPAQQEQQPQQQSQPQQPAQQGENPGFSSSDTCGNLNPRLTVGGYAEVITGKLNMRSAPSLSASIVQELHNGNSVNVVGGPICADGYTWWQVKMFVTGWSAEGGNRYYLKPVGGESGYTYIEPFTAIGAWYKTWMAYEHIACAVFAVPTDVFRRQPQYLAWFEASDGTQIEAGPFEKGEENSNEIRDVEEHFNVSASNGISLYAVCISGKKFLDPTIGVVYGYEMSQSDHWYLTIYGF